VDLSGNAQQVWIFLGESDQWHGRPLSLALLELLKRNGIAGGTVLRGIAGYGAHSFIHTASLVELSSDLPIVVTFVDRADRIARVMPDILEMVREGLITTTTVEVIKYTSRAIGPFPAHLTVADVMTRQVVSVRPDTPVAEIVALLIDHALRSAPVVDAANRVIGIITDGDLLTRGATELPLALQRELSLAERAATIEILAAHPHIAADLMTPNPITLPETTPLAEAAAVMADRGLKRIPVVDAQQRLVGMVSRSDLLATVAEGLRQRPATPFRQPDGAPKTVGEIMITDVPTVQPNTPLAETLDRLLETDKRRVIVVDGERRVIGIITDGDVMRRAAKRVRPGALRALAAWFGGGARLPGLEVAAEGRTAADVMTSPVVTLLTDAPIADAVRLMMAHRIKRIPVVDADGRLVGMVGRAEVLAALSRG
jgi:CBS domain-containing protein